MADPKVGSGTCDHRRVALLAYREFGAIAECGCGKWIVMKLNRKSIIVRTDEFTPTAPTRRTKKGSR